jgi:hypothetical protein
MKHTKLIAMATLLLLGASGAVGQSLGDAARAARKNKPESTSATRHYDNDNLPTNDGLSVVGPPPGGDASSAAPKTAAANSPADHQKAADEWKDKLDKQREKIESLNHELDLEQREYRLRAAAMYADAGNRLRNAVQWDKDDAQYKSDVDGKQKALEAARQELSEMQEQARKAGLTEKDQEKESNSPDKK